MARSAKPVKRPAVPARRGPLAVATAAAGGAITRNPVATGASTALIVATVYVAANALWYQPHAHRGALFATRDYVRDVTQGPVHAEPETTFVIERPVAPAPVADPTLAKVQRILAELNFYEGKVDGIPGPATSRAIAGYRSKLGLSPSAGIDDELLVQLGVLPTTSGIAPIPAPRATVATEAPAGTVDGTALVRKIQAGLRQFGNSGIDIDGVVGQKTRTGIREFQTTFGLKATGEADEAVYARMREMGLVD